MRTGIQLYSLCALDEPLPDLLDRVGDTPFQGVEFAGLGDASPDAVAEALSANRLAVAGAHVGIDELEAEFDDAVARYRAIGCETVVVPYLPDEAFESADAVSRTAERLSDLADRLADVGLDLAYHNHDHEFVGLGDDVASADDSAASAADRAVSPADSGGETAFERLLAETDARLSIELDAGWAAAAGHDPVALLDEYGDRIPIVHLKDVAFEARTPVELGEGDLDVDAAVDAARRAGVDWIVYEHDDPSDPAESLAHGAAELSRLVGADDR
ncbi:sugar phosphate isomerase/epimerase family protein [Halegenticoccus soli]|uniref:sugar phosphate isomerase/epimerase family protein n=1 Tax=Halegenticoccus soli TaxID=1985678 RepID=UPI000C6D6CFC|nr:sugar phosphate isomerase/epimerase [Halegenticoccus soli]